jgi:hypothetical protein
MAKAVFYFMAWLQFKLELHDFAALESAQILNSAICTSQCSASA